MNLNDIRDNKNAVKVRKRIGRGIGSGTGKTSGKGHKGQKARSGVAIKGFEGGQMPIHRRLPKRGFTNINRTPLIELNFNKIEELISKKKIDPKKIINTSLLLELGVIKKVTSKVKLLAKGEIKSKINIEVSAASISAKQIIEKIGGTVTIIDQKKSSMKQVKKSEA
ncbi:50S ribosomal protein L15 [Alphaproteobacteria bacterium]|nr:50S ribosomal protein L15 [Alphaproteobacteria bacterium]